jgi:DNA-binding protein
VTLSSLGAAISKTITIAEVVKHRVPGIHQVNEVKTIVLDDAYEPLEEFKEDLKNETVSRKLTCFQITLST